MNNISSACQYPMKPVGIRLCMMVFGLCSLTLCIWLVVGSGLSWDERWLVLMQSLTGGPPPRSFEATLWLSAQLPRLVAAMLTGMGLAVAGSVMQQLTQNPLVSPFTLGTASGSWLALIVLGVFFPAWVNDFSGVAAWLGALAAVAMVLMIVGREPLSGLPVVLAGMAVNILFAAIATTIVLLNDQYAKHLFLWGTGDLAQNGWSEVRHLLVLFLPILVLFTVSPRVLALLRMGQQGAQARGMNPGIALTLLIFLATWLVATSIAEVGVISFIGLMAPNLARRSGARTPRSEMLVSAGLGVAMLVGADAMAILTSQYTVNFIPTGTMAAFIGAPALIYLARQQRQGAVAMSFVSLATHRRLTLNRILMVAGLFAGMVVISLMLSQTQNMGPHWVFHWPDDFSLSLRWPRMLTALMSGAGLAVAGVLLQRLIYNPLASPDILGLSAGATFALVAGSLFFGVDIYQSAPAVAFSGSIAVLIGLIYLSRKHHHAPAMLILNGFAITAMIDAMVQFVLAKGNEETYAILNWLSGSTYRVTSHQALVLSATLCVLIGLVLCLSRWITLISAGRAFAAARGLAVQPVFLCLLVCVALLCSSVTVVMGPVAFVGLLAPHIAAMLGANTFRAQVFIAGLVGGLLLLLSDWLGQNLLYPFQIPAGAIVSILGGVYFIVLLRHKRRP